MNNKEFYTALMSYKASIKQATILLEKGFISADDYAKINTILTEKYGLSSCSIFVGNTLINAEIGGNITSEEVHISNENNRNKSCSDPW